MIQPVFGSYNLCQGSIPISYFNAVTYCQQLQNQIKQVQKNCEHLKTENDFLKKRIEDIQQQTRCTRKISLEKQCVKIKARQRRSLEEIEKKFKCSFPYCDKQYASDLALNLHLKNKHNGGTKTLRQKLAKQIVLAEQKGNSIPRININFPPGYLKKFKKEFFNQQ